MKTLILLLASSLAASAVTLTGTWNNTTFGSSGPLSFTYDINPPDPNFSVTLDLDGFVFGSVDPDPLSMTGLFSNVAAGDGTFSNSPLSHPTFGPVSGTVTGLSAVTLDMPAVTEAGIVSATIEGTLTPTSFDGTYRVNFTALGDQGGGQEFQDYAVGTLTAAVPEPQTSLLALGALALAIRRRRK